jgi:hypothetical protein
MPSAEFEPAIPVIDGPQTYDLDSMTTGISQGQVYLQEQFFRKIIEFEIRLF